MRTVRSAAWSRNRPRRSLAWLLVLILIVLIALAARVDAAPDDDPIRLAVRYADILTGADHGDAHARPADADDQDDDDQGDDDQDEVDQDEVDQGEVDQGEVGTTDAGDARDHAGDGLDEADQAGDLGASASRAIAGGSRDDPDDDLVDLDGDGNPGDATGELGRIGELGIDRDDATSALASPALAEPVTAERALLDAELAPAGTAPGDDASVALAAAGAEETYESWMRHQRPSRWGRLDVGLAWRRRWSEPMHAPPHRLDELWVVATWRR